MADAYTIREAAAELGLSRQRVYLLIRLHGVPTVRGARGLLLTAAGLERLRHRTKGQGGWRARAEKWANS
jgi:hypothetical protein